MGYEQSGLDMTGQAEPGAEPWRRTDGRGPGSGPLKLVYVPRAEGRAPSADALAQAGITLDEQIVDIATLADNSPLLTDVDAIIVEVNPTDPANLEAFDRLVHLAAGGLSVIAAVDGLTVGNTRTLLRAGALDVLPIPFSAEELRQAVEPARRPARPAATRPSQPQRRQGKVVAFVGALGGVGTTSIAVQTGAVLAATSRVGLVDLDVQFGSAALFLNMHPSLHLGSLIEDAERLDAELLQSVAVKHSSSLEVLPSPTDMMPLDIVTSEFTDQLLRTAVQIYDVVLVDLPQAWTEWSVRVLQRADAVVLVTNLSVSGVYQARRQLEVLEANGLTSKLRIIANRVPTNLLGRKADTKETETVLRRKVDHTIGNDYPGMSGANDEGKLLKDVRASARLLKDIQQFAASLSEALAAEANAQ
ncbi:MAG: hypothetical protein DI568_01755 [Sphingomonas sp.]|nr:MAG: hypothetical protein DI568_01755 [Sphingomonas sp.]